MCTYTFKKVFLLQAAVLSIHRITLKLSREFQSTSLQLGLPDLELTEIYCPPQPPVLGFRWAPLSSAGPPFLVPLVQGLPASWTKQLPNPLPPQMSTVGAPRLQLHKPTLHNASEWMTLRLPLWLFSEPAN